MIHTTAASLMLLKVTHQTDLTYTDPISESVMELRMAPRQEQDQHRLSFSLAIGPPTSVTSYFDWLGNTVHAFTINAFHSQIKIVATSVVETDQRSIDVQALPDVWPMAPEAQDYSVYDYLQFGGPVVDCAALRELVENLKPRQGERVVDLATRALRLINDRFGYEKGVTTAASPITDILAHGKGVCQDFTHLFIGIARALAIPTRYVSGLIHPDAQKYRGYTQTHAWCEIFLPSSGWVGVDPTNQCFVGANFVKVAVGRDFRDVPPNKGVYRGSANEKIEATVQSEELAAIPVALAAERVQGLAIPMLAEIPAPHRDGVAQQQEQQQQSRLR